MPRLGVLGTMVWDRIYARDVRVEPVEEWGGIAYGLAAAAVARPAGWDVVPILRLGRDLEERAFQFLRSLPGLDLDSGIRVVPLSNNRVELRYMDSERRCERMAGGVGGWSLQELAPVVADLDALYINFISGFELDLAAAQGLRMVYDGPIYADLHSLMLGIDPAGNRMPRPLAAWREWLRCFDAVQVNDEELSVLAQAWGDPWRFAAEVVDEGVRLLLVTLGERGAAYVAAPGLDPDPRTWREEPIAGVRPVRAMLRSGAAISERISAPAVAQAGDPTGCGDVWGATFFASLLGGQPLQVAILSANAAAARNLTHRGATGLYEHLRGRLST